MNAENQQFIYQGMSALLTGAGFSGSFSAYGVTVAVNPYARGGQYERFFEEEFSHAIEPGS